MKGLTMHDTIKVYPWGDFDSFVRNVADGDFVAF
ncbi:uncharacterized protein METZ01_LOCUS139266 [marine metagenome]|uniref:Uncharacterized protein n=1 Tax=marine metagenome TaxID=408172 RepID=A0A381ZC33_9ZZZZ